MDVTATAKFVRVSPKKAVLVARAVKGIPAMKAVGFLEHIRKSSSQPIQKLVFSAVANAKNNFGLSSDVLYIKSISVNKAPVMKRLWMRGQGKADRILKRMSHITVVLTERV